MSTDRVPKGTADVEVAMCAFCGCWADTYAHLHECDVLRDVRRGVPGMHLLPRADRTLSTLMLEEHVDGAQFARLLAFDCVVWAIRSQRMRHPAMPRCSDLAALIWSSIECPWLVSMFGDTTKKERRRDRVREPQPVGNAAVYQSDGASRAEPAARRASYGAAYWPPGQQASGAPAAGTYRMYIGDASNNVAEYHGLRVAMQRAVRRPDAEVVFQVDSDIVARQMQRVNASVCQSADLLQLHHDCVRLGHALDDRGVRWEVRHIYREYNQTADGLANLAIDDPHGNGPARQW